MNNPADTLAALAARAIPFLRDAAEPYEDDGGNEPLELAREIESKLDALASLKGEAEPVAWVRQEDLYAFVNGIGGPFLTAGVENTERRVPIYTTPPAPQGGGELLRDALPYLREAAEPYEDDGGNEPLELARRIEAYLLGEGE